MHRWQCCLPKLIVLSSLLMALVLLGAATGQPVVSVGQNLPAEAGGIIDIPVLLNTGGAGITSFQFGFDLGPCLTYRSVPGIKFTLPPEYGTGTGYDPAQTTQELMMLGYTAGTTTLSDGALLTIPFNVDCYPAPGETTLTVALPFARSFPPRFFDVNSQEISGSFVDGSLIIGGATQTPTPIPPTSTPTPTRTPTSTRTPTPTSTPTVDARLPTATPTMTPTITPTATPTVPPPTATPTLTPSATPVPNPAHMPHLTIGSITAAPGSTSVTVPINFVTNGAAVSAMLFSIDFDEQCLTTTLGDYRFDLPPAFVPGFRYDATDNDGEIDITVADYTPPIATLSDRTLLTLTFGIRCEALPAQSMRLAALNFSSEPRASFGGPDGQDVPGWVQPGVIMIKPPESSSRIKVFLPAVTTP